MALVLRRLAPALRRGLRPFATEAEELAADLLAMQKTRKRNALGVTPPHVAIVPDLPLDGPLPPPSDYRALERYMPDHHYERTVLIQQRPRSPMQRCRGASNAWRLTWQNEEERWSNPLMGWTSSADPMGCVQLKFDRAEEAVRFCEKKGWKYELREPINKGDKVMGQNTYAHNFLTPAVLAELGKNKMKTKEFFTPGRHEAHYFRPLKYHGDGEVAQHGKDPDKPWKE